MSGWFTTIIKCTTLTSSECSIPFFSQREQTREKDGIEHGFAARWNF